MDKRFIAYIPAGAFENGKGHRVSIVKEDEGGHYPTGNTPEGGTTEPWYWGKPNGSEVESFESANETAREYNERRGITQEEEISILISSMNKRKS